LLPGADHASGEKAAITVRSIDKHILTGSVLKAGKPLAEAPELPAIVLFQALPKGAKMDLIVRQATETGLSEVVPFISEHSLPKEKSGDKKTERWRRIVKEARQQSGSAVDTRIHETLNADELFAYWEKLKSGSAEPAEALGLVFSPWAAATVYSTEPQSGDGSPLDGGEKNALGGVFARQKLRNCKISTEADFAMRPLEKGGFHQYLNKKLSLLVLAVGPEGGFSGAELSRFVDAGFKPLCLGEAVLRTETAALSAAAAAKIIILERAWWKTTAQ